MPTSRTSTLAVALAALLVFPGLGAPTPPGAWRHDLAREAFRTLGADPLYASVGLRLVDGRGDSGGSGVLIHPEWVLTAAHVVEEWTDGADYRWAWADASAEVSEVVIHPDDGNARGLDHRVDLALVHLAEAVSGVPVARLHGAGTELRRRAALVGHGTTQPANTLGGAGGQSEPGERYAGFIVVDSVSALHLFVDMDAPHTDEWNALGSAEPDAYEYFPLGGDSGGGAFVEVTGGLELVAIHGTVPLDVAQLMDHGWYGHVARLNRVAPQVEWIREVMESR